MTTNPAANELMYSYLQAHPYVAPAIVVGVLILLVILIKYAVKGVNETNLGKVKHGIK